MSAFDLSDYLQKIDDIIADPSASDLPANAPVVAMFLMEYVPELPPKDAPHNLSSTDIATELEDVCQLSTSEISAVMVKLGYRLWRDPIRGFVWSMRSDVLPPLRENGGGNPDFKSNV